MRNGYHAELDVVTAAGAVPVRQPRVNDKRIDPATDGDHHTAFHAGPRALTAYSTRGSAPIPLIVICQRAAPRRVVAP